MGIQVQVPRRPCRRSRGAGFTLIEVLIVVAIVGILAAVAVPQYRYAQTKARESVLKSDLYVFRQVIDQYYADKGKYPASLEDLVTEQYIRAIPFDPMTRSVDTWVTIQEEAGAEGADVQAEPGIVDVKSGAEGTGTDGRPYAEW